jgi:hypothetical protein
MNILIAFCRARAFFTGETCPYYGNFDLPEALAKAVVDRPFEYLVILRNGTVIECDGIWRTRRGWVTLDSPRKPGGPRTPGVWNPPDREFALWGCCFERDLEVRIADIMACADAPHGT